MVMFKVKTQFQIQFVQSNLFSSQKHASNRQQQQRAAKLQQLNKKLEPVH